MFPTIPEVSIAIDIEYKVIIFGGGASGELQNKTNFKIYGVELT